MEGCKTMSDREDRRRKKSFAAWSPEGGNCWLVFLVAKPCVAGPSLSSNTQVSAAKVQRQLKKRALSVTSLARAPSAWPDPPTAVGAQIWMPVVTPATRDYKVYPVCMLASPSVAHKLC